MYFERSIHDYLTESRNVKLTNRSLNNNTENNIKNVLSTGSRPLSVFNLEIESLYSIKKLIPYYLE